MLLPLAQLVLQALPVELASRLDVLVQLGFLVLELPVFVALPVLASCKQLEIGRASCRERV